MTQRTVPLKFVLIGILILVVILASALGGALADRLFVFRPLDLILKRTSFLQATNVKQIVNEDSVVVNTAEKASQGVVTVSVTQTISPIPIMDPFSGFGFDFGQQPPVPSPTPMKQDIGSGFVVEKGGIIVTNKHVVSDLNGKYKVITKDNREYDVKQIYRDPANDLAFLRIDADLTPLELGDSDKLKVGQSVIAIGTALGEFRHTVTTGVISGLGRGIDASAGFGGVAERLDNVIQTSAAINPGNSGGPLLNLEGQVIGVNAAVAAGAQSIGFAIPINVVRDSIKTFDATGKFSRPFLGIQYKVLTKSIALLNDTVGGAYVVSVIPGSSADKAGIKAGDIITKADGQDLAAADITMLATLTAKHKVGDQMPIEYVRNGQRLSANLILGESTQ